MAPMPGFSLPQRPGVGTLGKRIDLTANFFELACIPTSDLYMYNVQITPAVPKDVNLQIMAMLRDEKKSIFEGGKALAYDGEATLYYPKKMSWATRTEVVKLPNRRDSFTVKIEHVAVVVMANLHQFLSGQNVDPPKDCIQALDVVCRTTPIQKYTTLGSSFFSGRNTVPLDAGSEIWFGYHQSLRPAHGRLLLNIDVAASVFHRSQPVIELVQSVIKQDPGSESARKALRSQLIGVKVFVTHRGDMKRKYRIRDVAKESAEQLQFTIDDERGTRTTNVAKYFHERYKFKLQHPHLPLLIVGSKEKPTYLPIEVCHVVAGERITRKLAPAQTAAMIKKTAMKPHLRLETITKCLNERAFPQDQVLADFGMKVNAHMAKIVGRVLDPPIIAYNPQTSRKKTISPQMGVWQAKDASYFSSPPISTWGVVVFEQRAREDEVSKFLSVLNGCGKEHGVTFNRPAIFPCRSSGRGPPPYQDFLVKTKRQIEVSSKSPCQLLLIILPFGDCHAYGEIKRICDTVLDVPSQCMQSKHIRNCDAMYCSNLLLKINTKVGGINNVLCKSPAHDQLFNKPCMIIGADVTHGAAFSRLPSLAAVVASMDSYPSKYACETRAQKSRQEVIEGFKEMTQNLLKKFYAATRGKKPEKILYYRDGVSEGQFDVVLKHELNALREACSSLEPGYTPKVTFVIVQKRHHARFFVNHSSAGDRSGNIPAGTVVDTGIAHPREFDFYLCSHAGIQGTSRPTHYHVIFDENKFSADALQSITYQQCYTYARCSRSVSLVPAVYYAHLAAARARYHSKGDDLEFQSGSGSDSSKFSGLPDILERVSKSMYWV